jgi:hypothetical protein
VIVGENNNENAMVQWISVMFIHIVMLLFNNTNYINKTKNSLLILLSNVYLSKRKTSKKVESLNGRWIQFREEKEQKEISSHQKCFK